MHSMSFSANMKDFNLDRKTERPREVFFSEVMSSKQMGQRRQTTVFHKWLVWHDESQDGRDQQNARDVVPEAQKL